MPVSSVPTIQFTTNGFVAPAESAILVGVQADINAAFGGNLNPALNTPQGQLAQSQTAMVGAGNNQFVYFTTQTDPATAQGLMQDAIGNIYFLTRNPAQPTSVQAVCSGLFNVPIPTGALAKATDGNLYICTAGGTIPIGGSITLPFACTVTGPIACPATSLDEIYQAISGWDSISNPADGVIGNNVETRSEFETRRQQSVAKNSVAILTSIQGNVLQVPNVLDAYTTENDTGSPVTITGVTLAANSLYVCVAGGDPQAVAQAIWEKKAPGCAYSGNTTETVTDTNSGYSPPYPTYSVTFETAVSQPILFAVTLKSSSSVPSNALTLVQNAIIGAFAGTDGGPRARIGSGIFASRYYTPVSALGTWAQIVSIVIGSAITPAATFTASITAANMTVSAVATGALVVGNTVIGANVLSGTTIVSQTSGTTGSTGVYVVSNSQTVMSEAMSSVTPVLNDLTMPINQVPTISAANITLTLV